MRSVRIFAGTALSLCLSAFIHSPSSAQTYFIQNGSNALNNAGYDPSSGISSVLLGKQSVIAAGRQNAQSAQDAYADISGQTASNTSTDKEAQAAKQAETVENYGFGLLNPKKTDALGSAPDADALARKASSDADTKERIQAFLNGRANTDASASGVTETKATPFPPFSIIKGRAVALDAITLKINGKTAILSGLSGPGLGVMCYSGDLPWSCGDKGRDILSGLLHDTIVTCKIRTSDMRAACITDENENLNQMVAERGYAISTDETTQAAVSMARADRRGIFQ